jgi:ribosome-binding factor A
MDYRKEKINHLLAEEISQIFLEEMAFPPSVMVSIVNVQASDDFKHAKVMISVFPFEQAENIMSILEKNIYHIQQIINKKLCRRPVPKISFEIDTSLNEADKVEKLLNIAKKSKSH